jgi:MFS family permease
MATATATTPSGIELDTRDGEQDNDINSIASEQSTSAINDVGAASPLADSTAPDGGSGWVIVLGCAVQTFLFYGITSSWGVFQAALIDQDLAGSATLSFVGSVTVTCAAIMALAGARILRLLGSRTTSILGIIFLATGQILSGFTTNNIGGLFMTAGFVTGIGNCLCFMVCSVSQTVPSNPVLWLAGCICSLRG